ncbi:NAD(P)/FAD-dependent oxidoreductase [Microbulbifer sp. SA54]|uniref:NAD(P)/FAD-dependent oxidoreductase n=1 Tax=Microbulbifer sp. SA54 TaxID=3401577 RepID=UPI003AAE1C2A
MNKTDSEGLKVGTLVVGAGIVGTTIAEQLQCRGHDVMLLDRDEPGRGCSFGNAGHFATDVVLPLANMQTILSLPKIIRDPLGPLSIRWSYLPKILPWLARFAVAALPHNARASCDSLRALNGRSIESYDRLLKRTGLTDLMTKNGALTVYEAAASIDANAGSVALLKRFGVDVELKTGDEIRELEPALSQKVAGGLYFPKTAHSVNPFRLVSALAEVFRAQGGAVVQGEVVKISPREGGGCDVILNDARRLCADRVIVATGAWSKPLAAQLGYRVPLDTERGYHLMLPESDCAVSRPLVSYERAFVMTPMEEGLRLAGTVELAGLDAEPNYQRADILFQHAQALLPQASREGATQWMGFRPSLPDSLPVIGAAPKHRDIYFAFGHQHLGLTQAAVTAELVADLVEGKVPEIDLNPYAISRFGLL